MTTIRLTAAQAMVRWLSVQLAEDGTRYIEGIWAIFGHGNVAGFSVSAMSSSASTSAKRLRISAPRRRPEIW